MEIPRSKTKNLKTYTYLMNYQTLKAAYKNLEKLASHLKRHKNGIISCITQARRNPKIYLARARMPIRKYPPGSSAPKMKKMI
jgi:hypothetical protein